MKKQTFFVVCHQAKIIAEDEKRLADFPIQFANLEFREAEGEAIVIVEGFQDLSAGDTRQGQEYNDKEDSPPASCTAPYSSSD